MASLAQRSGVLGTRLAAHLLRRSTYQVTKARIDAFALKTADQAVDELLNFPALTHPAGPVSYLNNFAWITETPNTYNHGDLSGTLRRIGAEGWWINELFHDTSMRGRLSVFHRTVWVTGLANDGHVNFNHFRLLQEMAKGSIRDLAYKMTLDIKMLFFLDNRLNLASAPNENYAREFLELFTILKGPQIGPTNYTNYTENDIVEAARVLTGFTGGQSDYYRNNLDPETGLTTGIARHAQHDTGNKTFSAAFNNTVITGAVNTADNYRELNDFIDMVFGQLETARAYCRRLYRFFVCDIIDAEIESDIIEPLAIEMHANNYNVEIAVKHLLKSTHFYDEDDSSNTDEIIGGKLKSAMMLWLQTLSYLNMGDKLPPLSDPRNLFFRVWSITGRTNLEDMGQLMYPLTVEGYPGYFKEPDFSKNWFDSSSIANRYRLMESVLSGRRIRDTATMLISGDTSFQADVYNFVATEYSNQLYADTLLLQILETTFSEMPEGYDTPGDTTKRYDYFREALLGDLSPVNWKFEWQFAQGGNADSIASATVALERLFTTILSSPEFQTF